MNSQTTDDGFSRQRAAMITAVCAGDVEMVSRLLDAGAAYRIGDDKAQQPLYCAFPAKRPGLLRLLVDRHTDAELPPLHRAVLLDDEPGACALLAGGAAADGRDAYGDTPLHWAARMGHATLGSALLRAGVPVDLRGRRDKTPLSLAAQYGCLPLVAEFLAAGADPNASDSKNMSPLRLAAHGGYAAVIEKLIAAGADKEARDAGGYTPLIAAAIGAHVSAVAVLLAAGAKTETRLPTGATPLHCAAWCGHEKIVGLLLAAGADKEAKATTKRATPLHVATVNNHEAAVSVLLAAGVELETKDQDGRTALQLALQWGCDSIAKRLRQAGAKEVAVAWPAAVPRQAELFAPDGSGGGARAALAPASVNAGGSAHSEVHELGVRVQRALAEPFREQCLDLPLEAVGPLMDLMAPHGVTPADLLAPINAEYKGERTLPWAVVVYRAGYWLRGHLEMLRRSPENMYIGAWRPGAKSEPVPVSLLAIRRKPILEELAPCSPMLQPAWVALRGCAADRHWLCILDGPAAAVVSQLEGEDEAQHVKADAFFREEWPDPGRGAFASDRDALLFQLGMEAYARRDGVSALRHLDRVALRYPHMTSVWLCIADVHAVAGRFEEAVLAARRALRVEPDSLAVQTKLATLLTCCRRTDEALAVFRLVTARDPFLARAWGGVADCLRAAGAWEEAIVAMERYFALEEGTSEDWRMHGLALFRAGRASECLAAHERAVAIAPGAALAWNGRACALIHLERVEEAIESAVRALRINDTLADAWDTLGTALSKAGSLTEAVFAFSAALQLEASHPQALHNLTLAWLRLRRGEQAQAVHGRLARCAPALAYRLLCGERTCVV